jgi:peptide/nickel transport system substrate-binding protein
MLDAVRSRSALRFVALVSTLAVLAACAGEGERAASPQAGPEQGAPAQEPRVRRLVMGVVAPGTESNAPRLISQTESWQIRPMYEHLIGIDPQTGKYVPQLATEWNVEPDGHSFRFKLRRGVQFHGGHGEFSAKDVVFSYQDTIKDDAPGSESVLLRNVVDRIEVVNEYEVVFHLKVPDVDFESVVSQQQGALRIMSKAHFDAVGEPTLQTAPIAGTAPYQFKERAQGAYVRFERVPYQHWRVTPDFPEFEFRFQNEASSRLAALLTGEIQITSLPLDLLPQAESQGYKVIRGRVPALRAFMAWQCCFIHAQTREYPVFPNSPLMDPRVRRALNKAINRDELNRAFFAGKGELMYLNHFHPTREGWDPSWVTRFPEEYGYDPARARALLAEAGQPNLRTNILLRPLAQFPGAEDVAEAVAGYWRAVGADAQLVQIDPGEINTGQRGLRFDNHVVMTGTSGPQFVTVAVYNSSVLGNYLGAQQPEVQDLVKRIRVELDAQKRGELFRQEGNKAYELHLDVPLFWLTADAVVDPKLVADYLWPGSISGTWTHPEYIKAAR